MAITPPDTPRCTPEDWKYLRCLVSNGMVFEVQAWIRSGHPTLRPMGVRTSVLGMAVDRQIHSMVRVLWEFGWQEADEAAVCIDRTCNGSILRYLLKAGCPAEELSAYSLCHSHDVEAIRLGVSRGVKLTGPDGWADSFVSTASRPLIRFFLEEKDRIPDLKQEGVHALCMAIQRSRLRAAALLVWAGVDPLARCSRCEAWDEPPDTWDGCPAEYLSYSQRGLEVLKVLKLKPDAGQWLKLLDHAHPKGAVLEKLIALKGDAQAIIENNPAEATNILMGYFESTCWTFCHGVEEYAAACRRLMELGAVFAFREGRDPARARRQIYASRWHREILQVLDFAWRTGCKATQDGVRQLVSKPRIKELARKYTPVMGEELAPLGKLPVTQNKISAQRRRSGPSSSKIPASPPPHGDRRGSMAVLQRDELHRLVWDESTTRVATRLGISGSMLGRICTALQVPRPGRGYWAKSPQWRQRLRKALPAFKGDGLQYWAVRMVNVRCQREGRRGRIKEPAALPGATRLDEPGSNSASR